MKNTDNSQVTEASSCSVQRKVRRTWLNWLEFKRQLLRLKVPRSVLAQTLGSPESIGRFLFETETTAKAINVRVLFKPSKRVCELAFALRALDLEKLITSKCVHRYKKRRLTTQAQRPGPRGRSIATWTRWPGSLQRMVST